MIARETVPAASRAFTLDQTHRITSQSGNMIDVSSEGRRWSDVFVSRQREIPFERHLTAVPDHLLVLHLSGPVTVHGRFEDGPWGGGLQPPGHFFLWPGAHAFSVSLDAELLTLHVYLRDALVREVAEALGADGDVLLRPRLGVRDGVVETLLLELAQALHSDDHGGYADLMARALAARLLRAHSSLTQSDFHNSAPSSLSRSRLKRVRDYIEAHLEAPVTLPMLAANQSMSVSRFARAFKAACGMTPHQYLMARRYEQACRLLAGTALPIAQIAADCGFSHQQHLTLVFRKRCGMTPAAYRRSAG